MQPASGASGPSSATCGGECERHRFRCIRDWAADIKTPSPPELLLEALEGPPTQVTAAASEQRLDGRWSIRAVRNGVPLECVAETWQQALALLTTRLLEEASVPAVDLRPSPLRRSDAPEPVRRPALRLSQLNLP